MPNPRIAFAARLRVVWALAAVLVLAFVAACDRTPPAPLRIGTNVWPGYEPLYLARERGHFGRAPIRLVEYTSATDVLQAFRNGAVEAAALTLDEALLLAEDAPDLAIVLVLDVSNGGDVLLAQPEIDALPGLRGRRVGVESTALGAFVLTRALHRAGLKRGEIVPVALRIDEMERAYRERRVDAVVAFEPVRARLLADGARELFSSRDMPGEVVDVLVARRDFVEQNAITLQALLRGWFAAVDDVHRDPAGAAQQMAPRLRASAQEVQASLGLLKLADRAENLALLDGNAPGVRAVAQRLGAVMLAEGLLRNPPRLATLVQAEPLRALQP